MNNETADKKAHSVSIDGREHGTMTGVDEVISYGDDELVLSTACGRLTVAGKGLKIVRFNSGDGSLAFTGTVNALRYDAPRVPVIKRIFK